MRLERREKYNLLWLATDGSQAIRIPKEITRKEITDITTRIKTGTPNRKTLILDAIKTLITNKGN